MDITKAQRAFYRKLYLAYCIDTGSHNLRSLQQLTRMPRRTIQDTLSDLGDIGIRCQFEQAEGMRHNDGIYRLEDWGPIRRRWVESNLAPIRQALGCP